MKKLKTMDAETLLSTPIASTSFIVDEILPPGLHIISGSPKIGKSWLMLTLCLKVAQGELFWDFKTTPCSVLYLCLEDTFNRIQNRLFRLTDEASENLHFAVLSEQIDTGLLMQIEEFITQRPDTRLIVIDTLQRIRGSNTDNNSYANDYREITTLKYLVEKYKLALILVHHLRKQSDIDPFNMVSGTTGLTGAVDSTFVLVKKERSDDTAKLYLTGRDVEYQEFTLRFNNCKWELITRENQKEVINRETPDFIFQLVTFMQDRPIWQGNATELLYTMEETEVSVNAVTKLLNEYHNTVLADSHICYSFNRTGKSRLITLKRGDGSDSYDVNDGTTPIPNKLSQPSQAVTGKGGKEDETH